MYVLNKKTGNVQECHNMDAIKSCRKDTETYSVAERPEDLAAEGVQKTKRASGKGKTDKSATEKKGADSEADMSDNGGQRGSDKEKQEDKAAAPDKEQLSEMDLQTLEEKAKELGIPGYSNMNKDTLIAMILNH